MRMRHTPSCTLTRCTNNTRSRAMARCVLRALLLSSSCQALVLSGARARAPVPTMSIIERPDSALFCLNVCLRVKPERREEFLDCIRANQEGTLATEPLAVTYAYGEDESTPNTWRFFEQYLGKAGFEAHTQTDHFAAWEAFASSEPSPFSAPPEVRFFVEDSAASVCAGAAAVREVLDDGDFTKLFCLDVTMSVKPESRDAFLEALRHDQKGAVAAEPLAVSYLFGEDTETANVFHMFEAYSGGRDGFAAHAKTPHYAK
jgi:quinol monooxygenase YgiN